MLFLKVRPIWYFWQKKFGLLNQNNFNFRILILLESTDFSLLRPCNIAWWLILKAMQSSRSKSHLKKRWWWLYQREGGNKPRVVTDKVFCQAPQTSMLMSLMKKLISKCRELWYELIWTWGHHQASIIVKNEKAEKM